MGEHSLAANGQALSLADTAPFAFGDLRIDPATRTVNCAGRTSVLQPRVMQVLVALAEAHGDVVSRERLLDRCWNGRIVGDDALNRCIVILRTLARELGDCFEIENIARVGYRLTVRGDGAQRPAGPSSRRILWIAGIAMAFACVGAGLWWSGERPADTETANAAVQFTNRGRALMRTGNPQVAGDARIQFQSAIERDPSLAPAWAGLAAAIRAEAALQGPEQVATVLPRARALAMQARKLDPGLIDADLILAGLSMPGSKDARGHLSPAVKLRPPTPEALMAQAELARDDGDFAGEMAAYRKAIEIDPDWYRPVRDLAIATAEMGDRAGALTIARSVKLPTKGCGGPPARIAWIFGDIAEAARCSLPGMKVDTIWREPDRIRFNSARLALGLTNDGTSAGPPHVSDTRPPQGRMWMPEPPTPAQWLSRNRSADAALAWRLENFVGAKLLLNAGRAKELAVTYDSPSGLLGIKRDAYLSAGNIPAAAIVALALREAGRDKEALRLLARAKAVIDGVRARGPVPFTFDRDAAALAAVAGWRDRAVADLRQARSRGWVNNDWNDLLSLRDEPAFASLHGDPRFEAIASDLERVYERERREFVGMGLEKWAAKASR